MNTGRPIFTQVTDLIHREQFNRCMALHPMPRASKGMTARDQFLAMAFRADNFQGESSRHRSLFERMLASLRDGYPRQYHSNQFGLRERAPRLARIRGSRPDIDPQSPRLVCRRFQRIGSRRDSLCRGCLDYRSVLVDVYMGTLPQN